MRHAVERWFFARLAGFIGVCFLFGLFIWPTPWSYHYDRSGRSVVRLNRFTGYAERMPIHEPVRTQRPQRDERLSRWLMGIQTSTGDTLADVERDPDFQALLRGRRIRCVWHF